MRGLIVITTLNVGSLNSRLQKRYSEMYPVSRGVRYSPHMSVEYVQAFTRTVYPHLSLPGLTFKVTVATSNIAKLAIA